MILELRELNVRLFRTWIRALGSDVLECRVRGSSYALLPFCVVASWSYLELVSLEQKIPPIQDLLAFIEEQETRLLGRTYEIKGTAAREFQVIYGVCAQAIRYAAAFAALQRAGRPREAVVLARQAIEHAATAQWAHFTEGGLEKLITTIQATHLDFYGKMSSWLQNAQLVDAMEAETERLGQLGKGMPPVVDRLRAIDQDQMLEMVYKQQSQLVHVTSSSTTGFVHLDGDEMTLVPAPADPHGVNTTYIAAMAAMFAAWLVEDLIVGKPGMPRLDQQSDELLLPINVEKSALTAKGG